MANVKISQLPAATSPLDSTVEMPVVQGGVTKRAGAATIGFLQSGTGAVLRTAQDKAREIVSVKDFGAVGDGVADDTAAIVLAVNYAATLAAAAPVDILFPPGDYLYSTFTIAASRVRLVGVGRLIKSGATGDGIVFDGTGQIVQNGIVGLTLGSAVAGASGSLVKFVDCAQVEYKAYIKSFPAACYNGAAFLRCANVFIMAGCLIENAVNDGAVFEDCLGIHWTNGFIGGCGRDGVSFNVVSGVYASSVECFGNGRNGFRVQATITPVLADLNGFMFFSDCIADSNGGNNWHIEQMFSSILTGCWGATQTGSAVDTHGFYVQGCGEVELSGCISLNNNGCGLRFGGVASDNVTITGGRFNNNGKQSGSAIRAGISIMTSCQVTINGTRMSDVQVTKTQQQGLQLDATLVSLSIGDCDMRGNASAPYLFAATPSLFRQANNLTGETASFATATSVTVSPFIDVFILTGTTDVYDIVPKWTGREVTCMMTGNARFVDVGSGGGFRLPAATITPDNNGTATFAYNGTNWLCTDFQVNDGV